MSFSFRTTSFRRPVSGILLTSFMAVNLFCFTPKANAQVWGAVNIFSDLMINIMETIQHQIEGAILGTLKVAAIQMLNSKLGQLVGGGAEGPLFITDWGDFLYAGPAEKTNVYMNDFFTVTTRGKYAQANYQGVGGPSFAGGQNYPGYLVARAQSVIEFKSSDGGAVYDLDQYGDPSTMFEEGDWRGFSAFFSNPANNPFGYSIMAESAYASRMTREVETARAKAVSGGGFLGVEKGGRTVTPAATIAGMVDNVQNMGNNMIAVAQNPGEFLSGVVSAVVNKAITGLIQKGVGQVQTKIQREIRNVDNQVTNALAAANKKLGPAAKFTREANQKLDVVVKTSGIPPPQPICIGSGC